MQEVGDLRAGDGGAHDDPSFPVDDEACGTWRVAAIEAAAGVRRGADVVDVELDPGLLGGSCGVPDGGDLRVGEHDARGERAVGAVGERLVVAEDVVGDEPRLVLAHVRQQHALVDVADRVQPVLVAGDAAPVVDVDRVAGRQVQRLDAQVLRRGRRPARRAVRARRPCRRPTA